MSFCLGEDIVAVEGKMEDVSGGIGGGGQVGGESSLMAGCPAVNANTMMFHRDPISASRGGELHHELQSSELV